jgi:hypothetical protein
MKTVLIAAALLLTAPLLGQDNGNAYEPPGMLGPVVETPHVQLGSDNQPSIVTVPPVIVQGGESQTVAPGGNNAAPANLDLLASRHFDYIVSPLNKVVPGSMEDTSISLGDYARQLRAGKQSAPTPGAMAAPAMAALAETPPSEEGAPASKPCP